MAYGIIINPTKLEISGLPVKRKEFPKLDCKLSRRLLKHIQWFHTSKCWNTVLNWGHWLGSLGVSLYCHLLHLLIWKSGNKHPTYKNVNTSVVCRLTVCILFWTLCCAIISHSSSWVPLFLTPPLSFYLVWDIPAGFLCFPLSLFSLN